MRRPGSPPATPRRRAMPRPTGPRSSPSTTSCAILSPSPVIDVNRALAVAMCRGASPGSMSSTRSRSASCSAATRMRSPPMPSSTPPWASRRGAVRSSTERSNSKPRPPSARSSVASELASCGRPSPARQLGLRVSIAEHAPGRHDPGMGLGRRLRTAFAMPALLVFASGLGACSSVGGSAIRRAGAAAGVCGPGRDLRDGTAASGRGRSRRRRSARGAARGDGRHAAPAVRPQGRADRRQRRGDRGHSRALRARGSHPRRDVLLHVRDGRDVRRHTRVCYK